MNSTFSNFQALSHFYFKLNVAKNQQLFNPINLFPSKCRIWQFQTLRSAIRPIKRLAALNVSSNERSLKKGKSGMWAGTELWNSQALGQCNAAPPVNQEPSIGYSLSGAMGQSLSIRNPVQGTLYLGPWVSPSQQGTLSGRRNSHGWDLKKKVRNDLGAFGLGARALAIIKTRAQGIEYRK